MFSRKFCRVKLSALATVLLLCVVFFQNGFSQTTGQVLIGGDVSVNFNFYSTKRDLLHSQEFHDYDKDFYGHAYGSSLVGSLVCSVPMNATSNGSILISATLEEFKFARHDFVTIPCDLHDSTGMYSQRTTALTEQDYQASLTSFTLGAAYQYTSGHFISSVGSAIGPYVANDYKFQTTIIRPDQCYYNYSTAKTHSLAMDSPINDLNFRLPINIRIGLLIPMGSRMYFSPGIGFNVGLIGINESGATLYSIQPGMGVRYAP